MEALIASDLAGRLRLRLNRETAFGTRDCHRLEPDLQFLGLLLYRTLSVC
jgi:hypothetical protein